jgi:hypothetical protein
MNNSLTRIFVVQFELLDVVQSDVPRLLNTSGLAVLVRSLKWKILVFCGC